MIATSRELKFKVNAKQLKFMTMVTRKNLSSRGTVKVRNNGNM